MTSSKEPNKEINGTNNADDSNSAKDEQVRQDIRVLSTRLADLKDRFMKIVQKINDDSIGFVEQKSDEDSTSDEESTSGTAVSEEDNDSNEASEEDLDDEDDVENNTRKSQMSARASRLLLEPIIERQARHDEYLKHVVDYPKIMQYLLNESSSCTSIPRRHLEPFINEYVEKNPNGKIYDKVNNQIQAIRRKYIQNRQ